jgi:SAM-dependent methyltransferase
VWDERYSVDDYVYGEDPNEFLAEMSGQLSKGRTLCLAEGEGRNAVHLAMQGFTVTAVDSSKVGLAKAERLARDRGVSIACIHADLADYDIEAEAWDSIVSVFCHLPESLRGRVHEAVVAGLKQGGTFLLEAYTPRQLKYGTGGPRSEGLLMELETLRKELAGLEFLHAEEVERDICEGSKHTGRGSVVQVLARKA